MPDLRPKLLIVEDDPGLQRQLRWSYDEYHLLMAGDRTEAIELLHAEQPPVVTLDLGLPPDPDGATEGLATLAEMLSIAPATKIIIASGHGERESARRCIALGAWDFYQKPIDLDSLRHIVGRAFHVHRLEQENARLAQQGPDGDRVLGTIITAAPEMLAVAHAVERVAPTDVPVMLLGASGTGKELIARALHGLGQRAATPLVMISCGAIPSDQLELELFAPGGRMAQATGGTIFIDEVGDLPAPLQARLLHHLEEGAARPVTDAARIICASHRDIDAMLVSGAFREDLYYRLAGVVIRIPSLADRPGDAALLARHFLRRHASQLNAGVTVFAPDAIAAIEAWSWPGNVRELENRVKRALIVADGKRIGAADLDLAGTQDTPAADINLRTARERADQAAIRRAIARADGNISGAARLLGISRPTLYDLMKGYGLNA